MIRTIRLRPAAALLFGLLAVSVGVLTLSAGAQSGPDAEATAQPCTPDGLSALLEQYGIAPDTPVEDALPLLYQAGLAFQTYAVNCGYTPTDDQSKALAENILAIMDIPTLLRAKSVGTDVDAILAKLKDVTGDSFNGQLLYNGINPGLDGSPLGCSGCHDEGVAPPLEGTWTRITDVRLNDPALAGYTVDRYMVESIVNPNAYIAPGFNANLMPPLFGDRLDIHMLADIMAYLDSQDQLLPDSSQ